jgi:nitric oxide reductase activation protein
MSTPLSHWLRLLWGQAPRLHLDSEAPFIGDGEIHLPACSHWRQHRAAAAHAAAHLVYSPRRFDGTGLPPITRAVLALLEDARAEALASRELPGLARLWQPLHTATPDDGAHFEALLPRLARALADPGYADTHPWVAKGRRLFYLDAEQTMLALRQPAELHQAARRLGHDIGQMRLQFNAKTYRPAPAYRDDHRWMWGADALAQAEPPPAASTGTAPPRDTEPPAPAAALARYPEWDRLIQRLRRDWSTVIEQPAQAEAPAGTASAAAFDESTLRLGRRLNGALRTLARPADRRRPDHEGERFDIDALVRWRVAGRLGRPCDTRLYSVLQRQAPRATVWLLIDQSASTSAAHGQGENNVLQAATLAAAAAARALHRLGVACAISGFSSNGRHAVHLHTVKSLGIAMDGETLAARLRALRSAGSTRLGAALRHAAAQLATHPAARRGGANWVLLLSDAEAHDVDVHDPRYLVEDARQAVRAAARRSVRMACLTLAPDSTGTARRVFGPRGARSVETLEALPQAIQRLLA